MALRTMALPSGIKTENLYEKRTKNKPMTAISAVLSSDPWRQSRG